tara:strand:+ start:119 stop:328 length:210 start_codon:yes stop_codon:yes gene_type:complete
MLEEEVVRHTVVEDLEEPAALEEVPLVVIRVQAPLCQTELFILAEAVVVMVTTPPILTQRVLAVKGSLS